MAVSGLLIGLIVAFYITIPLAMSIASIVIGSQWVNTPCSTQALIPLSTWLFAYGGVQLGLVVFGVFALILFLLEHVAAFVLWVILLILGGLFMFAWNIVGAVSLFRDANSCMDQAYPLWAMTLAVLIVQWIGMCVSCFSSKASNDSA